MRSLDAKDSLQGLAATSIARFKVNVKTASADAKAWDAKAAEMKRAAIARRKASR